MPTREEMRGWVASHVEVDVDLTTETAIWIRQDEPYNAWLVEVVPELGGIGGRPARPVHFNPSLTFRYPAHLIACSRGELEEAMREDHNLAFQVARGDVLCGEAIGEALVRFARDLAPLTLDEMVDAMKGVTLKVNLEGLDRIDRELLHEARMAFLHQLAELAVRRYGLELLRRL